MPPSKHQEPKAAPKDKGRRIRVRAVRTGYYEHVRRRPGDVFTCFESEFSDAAVERYQGGPTGWMERVGRDLPESVTGSQAALDQEQKAIREMRDGVGAGLDEVI